MNRGANICIQCGTINTLKLIPEQDGVSATAIIEFESKEDVLAARTKDMKIFDGNSIEVQIGSGSTLYVTNFPSTADEAYIRNLFDKVNIMTLLAMIVLLTFFLVWRHRQCPLPLTQIQHPSPLLLRPIQNLKSSTRSYRTRWNTPRRRPYTKSQDIRSKQQESTNRCGLRRPRSARIKRRLECDRG